MATKLEISRDNYVSFLVNFITLICKILITYYETIRDFFKPPGRKSIKGQNVLITGSGHGLGRELALKLVKQGVNLILVDINEKNNQQVKRETEQIISKSSIKQKVFAYSVDIRDENEVAKLATKVGLDLKGDVDILINNAGIVQCLPFLELSPAMVERTFQVNTLAHIWTIKHFLPGMMKNERGHIVAIASIAGLIGGKFLTDYCASKFAVVGLMESLDKEIHDLGLNENVHLTTVCPSSISTGMFQTFTSRFSWLLPILNADQVAEQTIDAILTNKPFIALPPITLIFHRISSIVPTKVSNLIQNFLDYGVKPHAK